MCVHVVFDLLQSLQCGAITYNCKQDRDAKQYILQHSVREFPKSGALNSVVVVVAVSDIVLS